MNFEAQEPKLLKLGWNDFFRKQLTPEELRDSVVARVVEPLRGLSRVASCIGEMWAEGAESAGVGDWVVGDVRGVENNEMRLTVTRVLNRKTKLSRMPPSGKKHEQILCANAETVFIVLAMTQPPQLPGVERAITAAKMGGLTPVILLTKADVCEDSSAIRKPLAKFEGIAIHEISIAKKTGLEALTPYFGETKTVVLLGASGAGKSTLTNYLIQSEAQLVSGIRDSDGKGRHTTTARRLHFLAGGGMIVDSPGIRELQLWVEPEAPAKPHGKKKHRPRQNSGYDYDEDEF